MHCHFRILNEFLVKITQKMGVAEYDQNINFEAWIIISIDFSTQKNIGFEYKHVIVEGLKCVQISTQNPHDKKWAWPIMAKKSFWGLDYSFNRFLVPKNIGLVYNHVPISILGVSSNFWPKLHLG